MGESQTGNWSYCFRLFLNICRVFLSFFLTLPITVSGPSLMTQWAKNLPAMQEKQETHPWVRKIPGGGGNPVVRGAWRAASVGSQRVGHDWASTRDSLCRKSSQRKTSHLWTWGDRAPDCRATREAVPDRQLASLNFCVFWFVFLFISGVVLFLPGRHLL